MAEQYAQATAYPSGYIHGQPECVNDVDPAPLDAQTRMLRNTLAELRQLADSILPMSKLQQIKTDRVEIDTEGLTNLLAQCHEEVSELGIRLREIAARLGRL